ncbi:gag-pol polyprotein [Hordeum vulgare]|nr:gag-pol polyprotein [Hordeum vulgare]
MMPTSRRPITKQAFRSRARHQPPLDDFTTYLGIFAKRLQGIFAFGYAASLLTNTIPKLKSATSMSYYNFDTDFQIPFYGTRDPEEYLEWERKMETYLKLLQVPSEDQVNCATRNFHDYVSTRWLHTLSKSFGMSWSKTEKGSKPLGEYFMEMNKVLQLTGVSDPIWMKFHFMMGLNNDIAKAIFTNTYKCVHDLYFGALKAEQKFKAKATRPCAHFATTKQHDYEHEDGTTKMSKPGDLQDNAPKSNFTAIPLCGIDYAESTTTLFEDTTATTTTTLPLMEHALEASDKVASKDYVSIFGGESDDVPSSAFIHGDGDEMVEHGIFPSSTTMFGDALIDFSHHTKSE